MNATGTFGPLPRSEASASCEASQAARRAGPASRAPSARRHRGASDQTRTGTLPKRARRRRTSSIAATRTACLFTDIGIASRASDACSSRPRSSSTSTSPIGVVRVTTSRVDHDLSAAGREECSSEHEVVALMARDDVSTHNLDSDDRTVAGQTTVFSTRTSATPFVRAERRLKS